MPDHPKLKPHAVAFVDLLGLRNRMDAVGGDSAAAAALLSEYVAVMDAAFGSLGRSEQAVLTHHSFSDSFALATAVHNGEWESAVGYLTDVIAQLQLALALEGWFIRGGIDVGDYFDDNRVIYGPALAEAYRLEQSHAQFPRVVLSGSTASLVGEFMEYYGDPFDSPQNTLLLFDIDNEIFVNYLYSPIDLSEGDFDAAFQCTAKHKTIVEGALKEHQLDPHLLAKYQWVARYHNFFVRKWLADFENDLLIPRGHLQEGPRLLVSKRSKGNKP